MTDLQGGGVRWPLLLVGGVCLVAVGLVVGYGLRPEPPSPLRGVGEAGSAPAADPNSALASPTPPGGEGGSDGVVTLTPEMVARAGIRTAHAETGTTTAFLRMPGVVQPN